MGEEAYAQLSLDQLAEHITRFSLAALGYAHRWHSRRRLRHSRRQFAND